MSLQKTWGNIHLTALGAMMLSFLLVGCDDSVAQNAAPPPRRSAPLRCW
jgi:multidrug efflux system membrane fusion protein